jgi:hypothetical protein
MIPDINEKLLHEHRQSMLREAEQARRLAEAQHVPSRPALQRIAARLGRYLIVAGTRLQRASAESSGS